MHPQTLGPKRYKTEELNDQTQLDQHVTVDPNIETPSYHNAGRGTPTRSRTSFWQGHRECEVRLEKKMVGEGHPPNTAKPEPQQSKGNKSSLYTIYVPARDA